MLNIDDRLLAKVNENEFWLLCHITKRLNKQNNCWPSNDTLLNDCRWNIKTLQAAKKSLIKKGLLEVKSRIHPDGRQGANQYVVNTELIGVFVPAKEFGDQDECNSLPLQNLDTSLPETRISPPLQNLDNISINQKEVLTKERVVVDLLNKIKATFGIKGRVSVTKERTALIRTRLKENPCFTMEAIAEMIRHRCREWKNTKFEKFIRIETLFQAGKFVGYMEESDNQPARDWTERATDPPTMPMYQSNDVEGPENFKF